MPNATIGIIPSNAAWGYDSDNPALYNTDTLTPVGVSLSSIASDAIWTTADDMIRGTGSAAAERFAVAASRIIGKASSGKVRDLTAAEVKTILALVAADLSDFDTAVRLNRLDQLAIPTSDLNLNSHKITGGATPTVATDFAIKSYVDALAAAGQQVKANVATSTTANITLSGEQTIDGVLTSTSRVLVKDQTDPTQNGIYVSAAGAWSRSTDADSGAELVNAYVVVTGGTAGASKAWQQVTPATITVGSSNIVWNLYSTFAVPEWTVVTKTGDYTAQNREVVLADCVGGNINITVSKTNAVQTIVKRIDSGANSNTLTITPSSGAIDGGGSITLAGNYEARWMIGDGTNVHIIGERVPFGAVAALGGPSADGSLTSKARSNHVHGTKITKNTQTDSYTLVLTDANNKVVEMDKGTATTLTIPPAASVVWEDGTSIEIYQKGAGQVTVAPGSGVTVRAPNGLKTAHQFATLGLRYRGSDEWVLSGDATV